MLTALGINVLLVGLIVVFLTFASTLFGPKRRMAGEKGVPYETGMPPLTGQAERMWISYYRYAVLFVIFDVDLAFLIPWVLLRHQLSQAAMISMSVFLFWVGL